MVKKFALLLMLAFGVSACTPFVGSGNKGNGSVAESAESDCGTIVMLRPAAVREGFSRDLDCSHGNVENSPMGQECFQYTVMLDHGGSFMIAQRQVPSLILGKKVCIVPDETGAKVMKAR